MIVLSDLWLSDFAISGSSTVPVALNFAQSAKSVQSLCNSAAAITVILRSLAALGDPCFSSFILSRTAYGEHSFTKNQAKAQAFEMTKVIDLRKPGWPPRDRHAVFLDTQNAQSFLTLCCKK